MPIRACLLACTLLFSGTVLAQSVPTAPPAASDSWSRAPAPAATAADSYQGGHELADKPAGKSHFKFRDQRSREPMRNSALEHSGKAPVMGGNDIGRDGRPTVNCLRTPMDPACR